MTRILSLLLVAGFTTSAFSQSLWTDNFETYNVGNLGTQGGWARDGGGVASWTKVANIDAAHGKSLLLASNATNADGVYQFHDTKWSTKSAANNIFVAEYDYFTGSAGAGVGVIQIYDVAAGFELAMEIGWDPSQGYMYIADGFDGMVIDPNPTPNTWYHIKATYNVTTGAVKAQVNNTSEIFEFQGSPGLAPTELDVLLFDETSAGFDNIKINAVNSDPFLAVTDVNNAKAKVSVYPNPATDVINVKSDQKVTEVSIVDVSGKIVKTSAESAVNVQNLAKGTYIVTVKFADGTSESKKVIKK